MKNSINAPHGSSVALPEYGQIEIRLKPMKDQPETEGRRWEKEQNCAMEGPAANAGT